MPSPQKETFEMMENMFEDFLGNGKIPKFKKSMMENLVCEGGLNIII